MSLGFRWFRVEDLASAGCTERERERARERERERERGGEGGREGEANKNIG